MYRNALDPYGLSYEPNLGWDSPEVTSTANALFTAQPSRFPRWELNALAGGENAKAGLFGKALGALGLDESGNRAATSWTDAAKHTAGNVLNAPQDIANQLLALREYQPVYGTAGDAEDRALAGRQAAETFGLAGLAPIAGVGLTRAAKPAIAREVVSEVATPTDATSGLVVQGYRGHSAEHGIGPRPGKPQAVFATPDEFMANAFAQKGGTVSPVEMRFSNPYVVDAEGAQFWRVPLAERDGLLGRMLGPKRGNMDELTRRKQAEGHDGIVAKNVEEVGYDGTSRLADQYVALQRGTVFDPATGDLLWSNPKEASLPALMSQSREGQGVDDKLMEIVRRYGIAAAAPLIAAYQSDGPQANALAGR